MFSTYSKADIAAIASFVAGGGLGGIFAFFAIMQPQHASAWGGAAVAAVSLGGLIRVIANPQATNTATVYDRDTGSTVTIKTVAPPTNVPASAPTYTAPNNTGFVAEYQGGTAPPGPIPPAT